MRIEIIYMDRTKDAEEYECEDYSETLTRLKLFNVTQPYPAKVVSFHTDSIAHFIEGREEVYETPSEM